jgi:hypothetical protein
MSDEARKIILARRAQFVAAALATSLAGACEASKAPDKPATVDISPPPGTPDGAAEGGQTPEAASPEDAHAPPLVSVDASVDAKPPMPCLAPPAPCLKPAPPPRDAGRKPPSPPPKVCLMF